jgi:hypothetical protein
MSEAPASSQIRIGDSEREAAMDALGAHMRAGRLEPDEYSERVTTVSAARYVNELKPLFADLPGAVPPAADSGRNAGRAGQVGQPVSMIKAEHDKTGGCGSWGSQGAIGMSDSRRSRLMAVAPMISLVLFFAVGFAGGWTYSWLAFFIVPILGSVLHGNPHANRSYQQDRRNHQR